MRKLLEEVQELDEGFANNIRRGMTPVGTWQLNYIATNKADMEMIIGGAIHRGMKVEYKGPGFTRISGEALMHDSLIGSLQQLNIDGSVVNYEGG